ncbi:AraC family transcriptional regulator [Endozoicomonas arenosclerae]|uniref:AraC family transcriptional regulator n=1 Tax=Endozoicomonas arenosclerae TaxID=1633495 RepID=UPI000783A3B7|nr:helix-turn-helix transcriptional regulator [Endozoicomonas arenosclerae]
MNDPKARRKQLESIPRAVIVYATDYPDGYSTGLHHHPFAQLVYATQGVMEVEAQERLWMIPPGRALWVPSKISHNVTMHGGAEMRTLYIRSEQFQSLPSSTLVLNISPLMKEMILEALRRPRLYAPGSEDERFVDVMVEQIHRLESEAFSLPVSEHPVMKSILNQMVLNPEETISLESLADQVNVSSRTLSRMFKSEVGMSFIQFRQQVRLCRALKLLAQGCPVANVAVDVGFFSQSAFIKLFKQSFGKTPGEYFK